MSGISHQGTALAALFMACVGWLGLYYMTQNVLPTAGARWLFFVLLYIAVSGSTVPFAKILNRRFNRVEPPDWVSVRQGLWMGIFVTTAAWLQIPRVLNVPIALLLALTLIVLEGFLRLRERTPLDQ